MVAQFAGLEGLGRLGRLGLGRAWMMDGEVSGW